MKLPTILPEGFLKSLPEAERKRLGKAGITAEQALQTYRRGQEKELQKQIASYLDLNQIYYETDRIDQKTSGRRGRPDFRICYHGHWVAAECKAEGCTLEPAQAFEAARLRKSGGHFVLVFRLLDLIDELHSMEANE
jgi:hypothetical protein